MVTINYADCNGCGLCVDECPTGALILQNNHAFIDQDICQECHSCIEACPQGAILVEERQPVSGDVIRMPAVPEPALSTLAEPAEPLLLREMLFPAIGSLLLWTGRELVPRLADMALAALDRRIETANLASDDQYLRLQSNDRSTSTRPRGRGRRRRRRAMRRGMS
jgi:NAD-dependent dihydropyrimidine dehydrogenase PreA subunit